MGTEKVRIRWKGMFRIKDVKENEDEFVRQPKIMTTQEKRATQFFGCQVEKCSSRDAETPELSPALLELMYHPVLCSF